ncbi:MAG: penicillin-binding transpeptidase domain-containing protein, partial [Microthrixaceae bacterium]
ALLAGVVQSPTRWDPRRNPNDSTNRRNRVLERMEEEGYISPEQQFLASAEPLGVIEEPPDDTEARYPAAHFVEEVKKWLLSESDAIGDNQAERYNNLLRGGLTITTTIDLDMQAKAEDAIAQVLPGQGQNSSTPDAALTSIDPATGYIRAMVGGRDFWGDHSYAKLNLAEGGGRSTGSAFKPIVLATALSNGVTLQEQFDSPSSRTFSIPNGKPWSVKGGGGLGAGNMAQCTVVSSNTCYASIVLDDEVGPEASAEMATKLGITSTNIGTAPAMVLGAYNATVRDMASVYATFANGGVHVPPVYVTKVERSDGTVLYEHEHKQTKVLEPEVSRTVNDILPGVIAGGTGERAAINWPAGGKTGSAQNNTDAWFTGFTHPLAAAVWVGFSEPRVGMDGQARLVSMPGVFGGTYPAQIWAAFMKSAMEGLSPEPLNPPLPPPTTTTTSPAPPDILDPLEAQRERGNARVPDVSNMIERNATATLRRAGFVVKTAIVDLGEEVAPGRTVIQSPTAGTSAPDGSTVWIEVTKGSPASRTPIPDLRGFGLGQATDQLEELGFTVTTRLTAPPAGSTTPTGTPWSGGQVWRTTPGTGELAADGAIVLDYAPEPAPPTTTSTTTTTQAPPED